LPDSVVAGPLVTGGQCGCGPALAVHKDVRAAGPRRAISSAG
jgi:hypothetical protein